AGPQVVSSVVRTARGRCAVCNRGATDRTAVKRKKSARLRRLRTIAMRGRGGPAMTTGNSVTVAARSATRDSCLGSEPARIARSADAAAAVKPPAFGGLTGLAQRRRRGGRTSSVAPAFAGRDMRRARVTERSTLASGPDPRCISGRPLGGREATRGKGARAGPAIVRLAARAPRDPVDPDGGLRE